MGAPSTPLAAATPATAVNEGRPPAPGSLDVIRAFLNSVDLESNQEDLATPDQLAEWLSDHRLISPAVRLDANDVAEVASLREALRDILEEHTGRPVDAGARARLDRIAAGVRLRVRFDAGAHLEAQGEGVGIAIGRLLAIVFEAISNGTWHRLKICRNSICRWAFYDASRNRSGAWCSMAICGNRMKGRAFRGRQRVR